MEAGNHLSLLQIVVPGVRRRASSHQIQCLHCAGGADVSADMFWAVTKASSFQLKEVHQRLRLMAVTFRAAFAEALGIDSPGDISASSNARR